MPRRIGTWIKRFRADQAGATMLEYALIVALVALGSIAILQQISEPQKETFNKVGTTVNGQSDKLK